MADARDTVSRLRALLDGQRRINFRVGPNASRSAAAVDGTIGDSDNSDSEAPLKSKPRAVGDEAAPSGTKAAPESQQDDPKSGRVFATLRIGEDGGNGQWMRIGSLTTLALGEEGGT